MRCLLSRWRSAAGHPPTSRPGAGGRRGRGGVRVAGSVRTSPALGARSACRTGRARARQEPSAGSVPGRGSWPFVRWSAWPRRTRTWRFSDGVRGPCPFRRSGAPPRAQVMSRAMAISSQVLVLNLPLVGMRWPSGSVGAAPGEPIWLTLRSLTGELALARPSGVFVCENPSIVEAAADRLGQASAHSPAHARAPRRGGAPTAGCASCRRACECRQTATSPDGASPRGC